MKELFLGLRLVNVYFDGQKDLEGEKTILKPFKLNFIMPLKFCSLILFLHETENPLIIGVISATYGHCLPVRNCVIVLHISLYV